MTRGGDPELGGRAQSAHPSFLLGAEGPGEGAGLGFLESLLRTLRKKQIPVSPVPPYPRTPSLIVCQAPGRASFRGEPSLSPICSPPHFTFPPLSVCLPPTLHLQNKPRRQLIFYSALFGRWEKVMGVRVGAGSPSRGSERWSGVGHTQLLGTVSGVSDFLSVSWGPLPLSRASRPLCCQCCQCWEGVGSPSVSCRVGGLSSMQVW